MAPDPTDGNGPAPERPARVLALITAAGAGTRMGARKQFLELTPGERIIDRVVATCRAAADWVGVIVPPGSGWDGAPVDAVIDGGVDRLASVAAGIGALPAPTGGDGGPEVVVVHSASHPLASTELIGRLVAAVAGGVDGAVPVLDAVDVIKRHNEDGTLTTVGRQGLGAAQAPMAWRRPALERALTALSGSGHDPDSEPTGGPGGGTGRRGRAIVEESAAVEAVGGRVVAVAGELINLHVTDPVSLDAVRRLAGPPLPNG